VPLKHILIAVPTMAGVMKAKTATTLVLLMRQLTRAGLQAEYLNVDSSDIVYARNLYAREVLRSKTLDGLLFVDSDMQFRPALVMKMLRLDAELVAAAYPKRMLDLDQFARAMAEGGVFTPEAKLKALANTLQYTVVPSWDTPQVGKLSVKRGFARMAAVGMGCALVSRSVLQAIVDGKVVERRKDVIDGIEHAGWGFFDCVKVGEISLSEDFSFCYRWTRMLGRDLWVCVDEQVGHLGDFAYQARYLDRLVPVSQPATVTIDEGVAAKTPDSNMVELDIDLLR
jgi:hypothetical protein